MTIELTIGSKGLTVIIVYGPDESEKAEIKEEFWYLLNIEVENAKGEIMEKVTNCKYETIRAYKLNDAEVVRQYQQQISTEYWKIKEHIKERDPEQVWMAVKGIILEAVRQYQQQISTEYWKIKEHIKERDPEQRKKVKDLVKQDSDIRESTQKGSRRDGENEEIRAEEVIKAIQRLKIGKAAGIDKIKPEMRIVRRGRTD
ncbi:hypothetical protein QE152_g30131 [Popillia japonica]|uniref:Uncharacterized protein n=1 Tax=Popillia japonica TaxID=7064 RepID=A0AAW1JFG9_POPJA